MKKIEAIIRSSRFDEVKEALSEKGINFFTFMEVKGYGHQKGKTHTYRGAVYDVGYIARMKLEIMVSESFVQSAIDAILASAKTGEVGDGKISIINLDEIVQIRTGLRNESAINTN